MATGNRGPHDRIWSAVELLHGKANNESLKMPPNRAIIAANSFLLVARSNPKVATMKRVEYGLALAVVLALAAPAWAQAPVVPTSPNDPASKTLGWIEAAPGSPPASPAPAAVEAQPKSLPASPPPATTGAEAAPKSPPASRAPATTGAEAVPVSPLPSAAPATSATEPSPPSQATSPAAGGAQKTATSRPKQPPKPTPEPSRESERTRHRSASDNMANQLNRQELGNISTARPATSSARP